VVVGVLLVVVGPVGDSNPAKTASERSQTHAIDGATTDIGSSKVSLCIK
jgi:hypothetical protein